MSEQSGLEMIESMKIKLEMMERRFANMELILKELLNRLNINEKTQPKPVIVPASQPQKSEAEISIEAVSAPTAPASTTNGKIKVMGQILDKNGRRISGVKVKISDNNNKVVKSTSSNRAGEWMSLLPIGKYEAEYFLENVISSTVNFSVLPGQTAVRVAQPNK